MLPIGRPWIGIGVVAVIAAGPLHAQTVQCQRCHGDQAILRGQVGTQQWADRLHVPAATLEGTVHERLGCTQCHVGFDRGFPHVTSSSTRECAGCHTRAGEDWAASIHASNVAVAGDAATCTTCHGVHDVYPARDRRSPTHALNVAELCGRCHGDERIIGTYFSTAGKEQARRAVPEYFQTVHGMGLTGAGLVVSATCNDCHGAHLVLPADAPASGVNRGHIDATCGNCHMGIQEEYARSSHGRALASGVTTEDGHHAPVCTDCHSGHQIVRADQPQWYVGVVEECGACHERAYETYLETYHGKVTRLGFDLAAQCSECHTAHAMRPASDPASSVYPMNLVATCRQCHQGANVNFAKYYSHGDHRSRTEYPLLFWSYWGMMTLLVGVMAFFLLHTALWLIRWGVDRLRSRPGSPPAGGPAHA